MKLKVEGVTITLTEEQIAEIDAQRKTLKRTVESIEGYEDACQILSQKVKTDASCRDKLNTIIRAANFIDNGFKVWKPDFRNSTEAKWYPYFEMKNSGLVFSDSRCCYSFSFSQVGFYLTEKSSNFIGKKFKSLYEEMLNDY